MNSLVDQHKQLVTTFYEGLAKNDSELFLGVQAGDVIYNVHGSTPVSGRFQGKQFLIEEVFPLVMGRLKMEDFSFSKKWKIMCADEGRVVAFMEAEGEAKNGHRYDQRYCHVFSFREGKIAEVWEFFDSVLAELALFDNPVSRLTKAPASAFEF